MIGFILQQLTNALNAGLRAVISYMQHPGRYYIEGYINMTWTTKTNRIISSFIPLFLTKPCSNKHIHLPRDHISDLDPYGISASSSGHM